jgi:transcriptional regulator with XRE-family HTH domain
MNMKKFDYRPQFSKNLIRLRKAKNLTQEGLAEKTGLSKRMIAYYETEAVKPPIDKIEIIAKALNVNINELLGTNETVSIQDDFATIDSRTLKKIKMILSLPKNQRHIIYTMAESFLKQNTEKGKS